MTKIYDWRSPQGFLSAFTRVLFGGVVVVSYRHVWTLIARADSIEACRSINRLKGRPEDQTLGFLLNGKRVYDMVMWDAVSPAVCKLFGRNPEFFAARLDAGLFFLKLPVRSWVPSHLCQDGFSHVVSVRKSVNWPAALFQILTDVFPFGVAISSLNFSGQPPIRWTVDAAIWCEQNGMPFLLNLHQYNREPPLGSYPIVGFSEDGCVLLREGHGLDSPAVTDFLHMWGTS